MSENSELRVFVDSDVKDKIKGNGGTRMQVKSFLTVVAR